MQQLSELKKDSHDVNSRATIGSLARKNKKIVMMT
jgi:hypothetical protein